MNLFSQWVAGQPWWVTLLLLPVEVLAGVAMRVAQGAMVAAGLLAAVAIAGVVVWRWRRRR